MNMEFSILQLCAMLIGLLCLFIAVVASLD